MIDEKEKLIRKDFIFGMGKKLRKLIIILNFKSKMMLGFEIIVSFFGFFFILKMGFFFVDFFFLLIVMLFCLEGFFIL